MPTREMRENWARRSETVALWIHGRLTEPWYDVTWRDVTWQSSVNQPLNHHRTITLQHKFPPRIIWGVVPWCFLSILFIHILVSFEWKCSSYSKNNDFNLFLQPKPIYHYHTWIRSRRKAEVDVMMVWIHARVMRRWLDVMRQCRYGAVMAYCDQVNIVAKI